MRMTMRKSIAEIQVMLEEYRRDVARLEQTKRHLPEQRARIHTATADPMLCIESCERELERRQRDQDRFQRKLKHTQPRSKIWIMDPISDEITHKPTGRRFSSSDFYRDGPGFVIKSSGGFLWAPDEGHRVFVVDNDADTARIDA